MISPVRNIETLKILANAIIVWLVVMEIWPMTEIQQAATLTLAISAINTIGGYFQDKQTTPLVAPTDEDGTPLVREGTGAPTRSATRAMRGAE
jgi:hypothetical protein